MVSVHSHLFSYFEIVPQFFLEESLDVRSEESPQTKRFICANNMFSERPTNEKSLGYLLGY